MTARAREKASLGPDQHNGALARHFGVDLHKEQITCHCIALKANGETERICLLSVCSTSDSLYKDLYKNDKINHLIAR